MLKEGISLQERWSLRCLLSVFFFKKAVLSTNGQQAQLVNITSGTYVNVDTVWCSAEQPSSATDASMFDCASHLAVDGFHGWGVHTVRCTLELSVTYTFRQAALPEASQLWSRLCRRPTLRVRMQHSEQGDGESSRSASSSRVLIMLLALGAACGLSGLIMASARMGAAGMACFLQAGSLW